MKQLVCLSLMFVASALATNIDPRGARPVQPATRSEKCATEKEWPFCTDDNWGPKCPSGCRIQGLMNKDDHDLLKKIEKIRSFLEQNRANYRKANADSKETYDFLRDRLIINAGDDNKYYNLAQNLRQRITDMKIKIDEQLRVLGALKDRVKDQVVEMQKLEVDIDIKLRSCKGSCQSYSEYSVDKDSYVALDKQMNQLDTQSGQRTESVGLLSVMKSRLLKDSNVETLHKSKDTTTVAAQQKEDMFPDVNTVQLVLEEEGSSSSPATVSKDPVCVRLKQQNQDGRQPYSQSQTYMKQLCRRTSGAALCSDDDWGSKCPSGCRLQGLISQVEGEVERRLRMVCKTAKMYKDMSEKSMGATTRIYNNNRRVLVNRYMSELKFVENADGLTGNLTLLRKRSSQLSLQLEELRGNVQQQLEDLYRTEVDIDMKLRACSGSCRSLSPFSVDHLGYQTLQADVDQMDKQTKKSATPPEDVPHVKLQPVDVGPELSAEYKTIPTVQRELLTQFEDIGQNQVVVKELE